jgi:hypothetical protein
MTLTDEQIDTCVRYWGGLIKKQGPSDSDTELIGKFLRHLRKILEEEREYILMTSLSGIPLFPLSEALKTSKLKNPFPNERIDLVFFPNGKVAEFRGTKFIKDIDHEEE